MPKYRANSAHYRKQFHKNYEIISSAYHEAGHAVFALLHFLKVFSVELCEIENDKIGGLTSYELYCNYEEKIDNNLKKKLLLTEVGVSYAGLMSEQYHFKLLSGSDQPPFFLKYGASDDIALAANIIKKYNLCPSGKKRLSFKKQMMKNSFKDLYNHWDAVNIIVQLLFKYKKVDYSQIKKSLCSKSEKKQFWKEQFKKIDLLFNDFIEIDNSMIKAIVLA